MAVWVVINPDDPTTPLAGVWTSYDAAKDHCPDDYVILKIEPDTDYLIAPVVN